MTRTWAELPTGRVIRLRSGHAGTATLPVEPLPQAAPAVVTYLPPLAGSVSELVAVLLAELEQAAVELFPAWLPGAERIQGIGGANVPAVRALARAAASTTRHFGPFLADLAELSLRRTAEPSPGSGDMRPEGTGFPPEVRAAGLARVLAAGFGRDRAAILLHVPPELSPAGEDVLVSASEWLADHGGFGVWLTGAPLTAVDRLPLVTVAAVHDDDAAEDPAEDGEVLPRLRLPAVSGMPHPASRAEKALEAALKQCPWAAGRAWNQTRLSSPLAPPVRVDLLWHDERCVVEIDGEEHREATRFAADRRRDVRLQLDGYAVLRFTNTQVLTEIDIVLSQLERFLERRRAGTFEGLHHHG